MHRCGIIKRGGGDFKERDMKGMIEECLELASLDLLVEIANDVQKPVIPDNSPARELLRSINPSLESVTGFVTLGAEVGFELVRRIERKELIQPRKKIFY